MRTKKIVVVGVASVALLGLVACSSGNKSSTSSSLYVKMSSKAKSSASSSTTQPPSIQSMSADTIDGMDATQLSAGDYSAYNGTYINTYAADPERLVISGNTITYTRGIQTTIITGTTYKTTGTNIASGKVNVDGVSGTNAQGDFSLMLEPTSGGGIGIWVLNYIIAGTKFTPDVAAHFTSGNGTAITGNAFYMENNQDVNSIAGNTNLMFKQ